MNEEIHPAGAEPVSMPQQEAMQPAASAEAGYAIPAQPVKKQKCPERAANRRAASLCGWGVLIGFTVQTLVILVGILLATYAGGVVIGAGLMDKLNPEGVDVFRMYDTIIDSILEGVMPIVMYAVVAAYFVGDLAAWLITRQLTGSLPSAPPVKRTLTARGFFLFAGTLAGLWGMGIIVGNLPNFFGEYSDSWMNFTDLGWASWPSWLMTAVAAPVFEELIFRKTLIDKLRPQGERTALIMSSLLFALVHQNTVQFFYAFGAGLMLGMLYLRTGRVAYTMLLHAMVNGWSVVGLACELAGIGFEVMWTLLMLAIMIAGIVCVFCNWKNPFLRPERSAVSGGGGIWGVGFLAAVAVNTAVIVSGGLSSGAGQRDSGHYFAAVLEEQIAWLAVLVTLGALIYLAVIGRKKRSACQQPAPAAEVPPAITPEG